MHKTEEIYFRNEFENENELNLFEPECIITDNPLNIREDCFLFEAANNFDANQLDDIAFNEPKNNNFPKYADSKDYSNIYSDYDPSQDINTAEYCESNLSSEQMIDLEHIQMHSIFSPEKRNKPKEIFTKCHNCEKFVIIRMCPETGDYSKCKYCFNSPLSSELASEIIAEISDMPKPIMKTREESINSKNEASFKCDHCGKLFTRNWYLKQHIKLHLNQKPFSCNHCDKRFLNSSNLKQHLKTHSVEYRCCLCDKTYISLESLKIHAQKHSTETNKPNNSSVNKEKLLPCNYCNENFTFEALKQHALTHTNDMPFQCDKCDRGFRYNGSLLKHKKLHHNESRKSRNLVK